MNILLIKASGLGVMNFSITQPLGLMYLASYLRKDSPEKYNIRIIDTRLESDPLNAVSRILSEFKPDIVGISALTMESRNMHAIAQEAKSRFPDCKVIAGGPHPTSFCEKTLEAPSLDYVVLGEGEVTFKDLVETIADKGDVRNVPGIAFRDNDVTVKTPDRDYIDDIDSVPFPAWDLVDMEAYFRRYSETSLGKRRYCVMFTSRSCPFNCIYCHKIFGKGFRTRSAENIVREIELLRERYGVEWFDFEDDIFNLDTQRTEKVCDMIIEHKLNIRISFPNGLRSDRLPPHLLEKLYAAGTRYIAYAIETGSPRIQKLIRKHLDTRKAFDAIEYGNRLGIFSVGYFMLGFPTETADEMGETISFALRSKLHVADFLIVIPFEGTELFEMVREKIAHTKVDVDDYNYFRSNFNLSDIPNRDLTALLRSANLRFYMNPGRIMRLVSRYLSLGGPVELLKYACGVAWNMFFKSPPVSSGPAVSVSQVIPPPPDAGGDSPGTSAAGKKIA